jgi:hypothetical protein
MAYTEFLYSDPRQAQQTPLTEQRADTGLRRPKNVNGPHRGPIHETTIDFVDGEINIGAFACPDMAEMEKISQGTLPLNNSRRSALNTILGAQKPERPQMPTRDEAMQYIDNYLNVIAPYVPIVHGPTFRQQVSLSSFSISSLAKTGVFRSPTFMTILAVLMTNRLK